MTCPRCNDTGYLRDRSECTCEARPFALGPPGPSKPWPEDELAFLMRLRERSSPGSNATPERHDEAPAVEVEPAAVAITKAEELMARAKRMGGAA